MIERIRYNWKRIQWSKVVAWYICAFLSGAGVYQLLGAIVFCAILTASIFIALIIRK